MEELFIRTIDKLTNLQKSMSADDTGTLCIEEAIARLKNLKKQSQKIISTNATLLDNDPRLKEIRDMMTDERVNEMLQEAAKTDTSLAAYLESVGGKVKKQNSSEISVYNLSRPDSTTDDLEEVLALHSETEAAYNNLWLIKERLSTIKKFANFKPKGVTNVRNHLMTHTKKRKSGAHIYSFGIATRGPVLRPIKPSGVPAPHDLGFESNIEEFLTDLEKLLR